MRRAKNLPRMQHLLNGIESLRKHYPPINNNRLPRHIIAIPTRQKAHRRRHILGHTRPAQRNQLIRILLDRIALLRPCLLAQFLVNQVPHGRAHDARRVSIDCDLVFCHFHGESLRHAAHGPLGGAVVREKGKGLECDDGGGAEEFAACALGDHLARGGGVAVEDAVDWTVVSILSASLCVKCTIDFEHALEVLLGEIEQCFDLRDAGIRNHGVERAEFRDRGLN
jgi:hypothetical protein